MIDKVQIVDNILPDNLHEMCLLATRGKPKRNSKSIPQLVVEQRQEHSRKPDIVYNHIENMLDGPYVELFARRKRNNWHSWGNEV